MGAVTAVVNVETPLSVGKHKQVTKTKAALLIVFSIQYVTCQGLAVCRHTDKESNMIQLLKL